MHMTKWMKLLTVLSLSAALAACGNAAQQKLTPVHAGDKQGAAVGTTPVSDSDSRKLTVVEGAKRPADQELAITNIRRIENANIEAWLSEEEVLITTTTIVTPATDTEEPVVEHKQTIYNLRTGEHRPVPDNDGQQRDEWTYRETLSPDGKSMFIEQFKNKYEADNYMVNLETGERKQVSGDYSMQNGGWLDNDTFVLSTNSPDRPAVVQIHTDGSTEALALGEKGDTVLSNFSVEGGTIYYTDESNTLKSFKPGAAEATKLVEHASLVSVSPDGKRIAVATGEAGKPSELLAFDTAGKKLGAPFAKGDLISYIAWSPDSAKLAFSVYTEETSGMNGVYVMSGGTGKVTLVSPSASPTYPLSWSPSGMRLGITQGDTEVFDFE